MARGSESKARRKEARKEAREAEAEQLIDENSKEDVELTDGGEVPFPLPPKLSASKENGDGDEEELSEEEEPQSKNQTKVVKKAKRKKKVSQESPSSCCPTTPSKSKEGIKTLPLVMLIMLTGTTLLPALLYAGDWFSAYLSKQHLMGNIGYKLGVGPSPRKRVISFYEKHDPDKIDNVSNILGSYYGDYPKLVKKLERKYNDYGYFLEWEQDEAPMTLAFDKLKETQAFLQKKFDTYAPVALKNAARNAKFNISKIYRKGKIVWRKKIWPLLEPIFGVPDGGAAQKRKDKMDAMNKKTQGRRKKNTDYRDEEEEF